jgi:hypothetical protein
LIVGVLVFRVGDLVFRVGVFVRTVGEKVFPALAQA